MYNIYVMYVLYTSNYSPGLCVKPQTEKVDAEAPR